jgi:diguanylate cyclase (GGDEF)-like protein
MMVMRTAAPKNPVSARRLTAGYLSALLIIAGLTIASHLVLTFVLHHNKGDAAIINISGRQRMLSQRIASLAAEYRLGDATARPDFLAAINQFEAAETMLSATNEATSDEALRGIYAGGADSLNAQARDFVADARKIAALPPDDPAAAAPLTRVFAAARAPLLGKLDEVVAIHQRETEHVLGELEALQLIILAIVLLTLAVEALAIFRPMISRIVLYTGEITRLATIDPLTELLNRRGFLDRCAAELLRARRHSRPLCLLMLDADHFKQINDAHGHDGGDAALRRLANAIRQVIRAGDIAGRLGGEEFGILLPETEIPGAMIMAERLRETIANLPVIFRGDNIRLTVSIGLAPVVPAPGGIEKALHDADVLLYEAKRAGRNRTAAPA